VDVLWYDGKLRFRLSVLQRPPQVNLQIQQEPLKAIFRRRRSCLLLFGLLTLLLTQINLYRWR
jgi:hypothetical protein